MARSVTLSSGGVFLALAFVAPASADIFTVGPDGEFATLLPAVAAADATAGDSHEIRLQAVTFTDKPFIDYEGGKTLTISGGWDVAFDEQDTDPEATGFTLPPGDDARPFSLRVADGTVELSNVALFGGNRTTDSGGLSLRASGTGDAILRDCVVRDNSGSTEHSIAGGGINIYADGAGQVRVTNCDIRANSMDAGGSAAGGGVYAAASNTAGIVLEHNRIVGNRLRTLPGSATPSIALDGAGVKLYAFNGSTIRLSGNRILDNVIEATNLAVVNAQSIGLDANTGGAGGGVDATMVLRGNVIHGNISEAVLGTRAHVFVSTGNDDSLDLGDTEISGGVGSAYGLFVFSAGAAGDSTLHVTNVTVADNDGIGVRGNDRFPIVELGSFYNNIVALNGAASMLPDWMDSDENLVDVPVAFAAPASGNYSLAAGSPAIDAGSATPPGGVGAVDAGGGLRVIGVAVDLGAHEFGSLTLFRDGFE